MPNYSKKKNQPNLSFKNKSKNVTKNVKKIVKKVVDSSLEVKRRQLYNNNYDCLPANSASFDTNIRPLLPYSGTGNLTINQGTGQGNRIGNVIKIKRAVLRYVIVPNFYNATTNPLPAPQHIKVTLFYDKINPQVIPEPATDANIFQDGSASRGFADRLTDLVSPFNRDRYRVFASRTHKVANAVWTGLGASSTQPYMTSNDFKLNAMATIDITKYMPSQIKYNDNVSIPSSHGLFLMVQAISADGNTSVSTDIQATMSYMVDYDYTDA